MNSFADLITQRRSTRQFTDEQLKPEQVHQLMQAALMAPTSKNSRPWHFVLVEDKEMLRQLSTVKTTGASFIADCSLAVVVLADPMVSDMFIQDSSVAATYIQLQAEDLGLGSCWVQVNGRQTAAGQDSEEFVRVLLDIPLQLAVGCIVAIGQKGRIGKPQNIEKLKWEKVHIGKFKYEQLED